METLDPKLVLGAYAMGVFPMADHRDADSVYWVEPRTRAILPIDGFHLSASLRKTIARDRFRVTADLDGVTVCNCSICTKKGLHFTFLPPQSFQLRAGEDALKEYLFNQRAISHQLCAECGVEVFARGSKPDGNLNEQNDKLKQVNAIISKLENGKNIFYLDIGGKFPVIDGKLDKNVMPDFLHLSPAGYQIWADAIREKLAALMH